MDGTTSFAVVVLRDPRPTIHLWFQETASTQDVVEALLRAFALRWTTSDPALYDELLSTSNDSLTQHIDRFLELLTRETEKEIWRLNEANLEQNRNRIRIEISN